MKRTDLVSGLFDFSGSVGGERKKTLYGACLTWLSLFIICVYLIGTIAPHSSYPALIFTNQIQDLQAGSIPLTTPQLQVAVLVTKSTDSDSGFQYAEPSDF